MPAISRKGYSNQEWDGFDPAFFQALERMHLRVRHPVEGGGQGEYRARKAGPSLEFADHRTYSPGDDLRQIDWNAYGRTGLLVTKLFQGEEDLGVMVLVDLSVSMEGEKLRLARRLAGALAALSLLKMARVKVVWFDQGACGETAFRRGRESMAEVFSFLSRPPPPAASTNLEALATDWVGRMKCRGPVFLLSDFLDPKGGERAVQVLRSAGFEPHAVQIFAPEEWSPSLQGDLLLQDSESGQTIRALVTPALRRTYQELLSASVAAVQKSCLIAGGTYLRVLTSDPFEEMVLRGFRQAGLAS